MSRVAAALAIAALALLVTARADANHVPNSTYTGTHANGGAVHLTLSSDGGVSNFSALDLRLGGSCPEAFSISGTQDVPVVDHRFTMTATVPFVGTTTVTGEFPAPGRAAGTMTLSCGATLAWSAATVPPPSPPPPPPPPPSPPPPPATPVFSAPYFVGSPFPLVRIVRGKPGAYDERVEARFRECSGTPPFRLFVTQRRRVGGAVVAQSNFSRALTGPRPAPKSRSGQTCRDYTVFWPLARKLYGAGWLTITLRIVDSRGGDSGAPNFAVRAPKP